MGSYCTCPIGNLTVFGRNCLILFQRAEYLPGVSENCFGCQRRAEVLEEGHMCLTETIEEKCSEFY